METLDGGPAKQVAAEASVSRFGFASAVATSVLTAVTFGVAIFTPPISGPSCVEDCIGYPYAEIASRFPRDYYWMFPAMLMLIAFVALMVGVAAWSPARSRVYAQAGLVFGVVGAAVLLVNYYVQVTVIQPSVLNGESDGIALLTQYNPHGLFIALEEAGYLLMSLSFVWIMPVFARQDRLERAIRWLFFAGFALAILALALTTVVFGLQREYSFEIAIISVVFLVFIVGGILLALLFRRSLQQASA